MIDAKRLAAVGIILGLFLLFVGAVLVDASNAQVLNETPEAETARVNLGLMWGPIAAHAGMFFFVLGLLGVAVFAKDVDTFLRLFLAILAFVTVLLVLASSPTIFGVPGP